MIRVQQLEKSFGKNEVLKKLNLHIPEGGIYAVLGPNGSGKTTLIKCILGMVIPDDGQIEVDGISVDQSWKYRKSITYMPQISQFPGNLRLRELLSMIKDLRGASSSEQELIDILGLKPFLNKKMANLSGGTRQKVNIVLALMFDCPILILDEPTTGLDPGSMIKLKNLLKQERDKGKTILVTSHIMSFVEEVADEIIYLLEGVIYFKGTIEDLKIRTDQSNVEHAIASITQSQSTIHV
ncbi:MAG TPA: ABC transporter ATP-binding protein [Membranihabitans sp.]|nr:ABC transporter ATP-binding protein [Membranihabitans sp.]